jgi:hypothetical protein
MATTQTARPDVYSRITDKIIADLEQGVRPWLRPWNAEHTAGRITRPLRHNGIPYKGVRHRTGRIARFAAFKENAAMLLAAWPWASWQRCP